jgi:hypothetical protein
VRERLEALVKLKVSKQTLWKWSRYSGRNNQENRRWALKKEFKKLKTIRDFPETTDTGYVEVLIIESEQTKHPRILLLISILRDTLISGTITANTAFRAFFAALRKYREFSYSMKNNIDSKGCSYSR